MLKYWGLRGAKPCKSCRSFTKFSNEYLLFACKNRRRYSRERAPRSLGENIQYYSIVSLGTSCSPSRPPPRSSCSPYSPPWSPRACSGGILLVEQRGRCAVVSPSTRTKDPYGSCQFMANFRQNFTRFRLYRYRSLQLNTRFSALFEIYKIMQLKFQI